ncbi:MAG: VOC family protein [Rhizobiales bacterium]|nr:VOC family protein [Hyphomicrobiales bacterium]MBI3673820.1 VOC family protein [Hyphomicrobiales bacterium]
MLTPQKLWWHELNTWDADLALDFYSHTLGWHFEPASLPGGSSYWIARKDGRPVGGVFELTAPDYDGIPSHWMTYLSVDDIAHAQRAAAEAGGEIVRPATEVAGVGRLAVVTDATGAMIGLFEPEPVHAASLLN